MITFLLDKLPLPSTSLLWNSSTGSPGDTFCEILQVPKEGLTLIHSQSSFLTLTPSSKQTSKKIPCYSYADESWSTSLWDIFHILVSLNWLLSEYPYKLHVDKEISQHSPFKRQRKSFFSVKMDGQNIRPANLPTTQLSSLTLTSHPG